MTCNTVSGYATIWTSESVIYRRTKLIKKVKYRRGHGLSRQVKQLKARGEAGGKDAIRDYMSKELKWKNWRRKTQSVVR